MSILLVAVFLFTSCSSDDSSAKQPTEQSDQIVSESETQAEIRANAVSDRQVLPRSKMDVLLMYKKAADLVKLRCPGFTRTITNEIHEISTQGESTAFLNAVLFVFVDDDLSSDSVITVAKDDDLACRTYFPVYDTDYGCKVVDGESVASAICYQTGNAYELIILFNEQRSSDGISHEFAQMMTPYTEEALMQNINAYIPGLHADNCSAQLRYYNCEIRCKIDVKSGHMLSMSQKMVTQLCLDVNMDLLLTETDFTAEGTMINHLDYTDFIWH